MLVTGADGFIGSHLAERLVDEGARVRAFCLYNSNGSLGWLDTLLPEKRRALEIRLGDVRDSRFVEEACRGIDTVFHLAALIAIPYSYQAAQSFLETNVLGTLNVLEAMRRYGCRRMIQTSTSEVYGTPRELPIRESHPLHGQSPYAASKIAADKICEAFFCSHNVPVVILRPFNTYGPRQSTRAVLPTILVQLLRGRKEIRLGNLGPRRDLTFVSDTVDAFLKAAEAGGVEGEELHLGTGQALSIGALFELACRVLGIEAEVREDRERIRPEKSEVQVLLSDPSKAEGLLGWRAMVTLEEGIGMTANWLERHQDLYDPDRYAL